MNCYEFYKSGEKGDSNLTRVLPRCCLYDFGDTKSRRILVLGWLCWSTQLFVRLSGAFVFCVWPWFRYHPSICSSMTTARLWPLLFSLSALISIVDIYVGFSCNTSAARRACE
ncbi:hypothetical protein J3458_019940 [Metarhizium acridum]|uniref:uncharacterized protein n=1 Tax=Metarhizium acridum TaxID=92637 RepID=UPI001C6B38A6|nr:hypothetical protein J3458_019940 [Metarhizium acridum]